jgi:hypothetical protein
MLYQTKVAAEVSKQQRLASNQSNYTAGTGNLILTLDSPSDFMRAAAAIFTAE